METHYGFKKLTTENFLEPDIWGTNCKDKNDLAAFAAIILEPQLSDSVPVETRALFEVARGVMIYGLFFYPTYAIALEQLFRVCENALRYKCIQTGISFKNNRANFSNMLSKITRECIISSEEKKVWENIRQLRNICSHPDVQNIVNPAIAVDALNRVTDQINSLFEIV